MGIHDEQDLRGLVSLEEGDGLLDWIVHRSLDHVIFLCVFLGAVATKRDVQPEKLHENL